MKRHAVWRAPIALALVSTIGLVAGLLGDDVWDWAAWAGLGLPLLVCARFAFRRTAKATTVAGKPPLPTIRR